eukprot:100795-Pyramimonas_sp.AAC.1
MTVLGHDIYSTYLLPAHPDVEYRNKEARACFIGQADFFRNRVVAIRDKFCRYQDRVQSVALYSLETCTADTSSLHMLNAFEGWCLYRMFRRPRREEETMADWNRRRYHEAREQFRSYGFATSLVQRFLRTVWNSAKVA